MKQLINSEIHKMSFPVLPNNFDKIYRKSFSQNPVPSFVSQESLDALRLANQYYTNIAQLTLDLSGKSLTTYHQCMVECIRNADNEKFHEETVFYKEDQLKIKTQRWREQARDAFNNVDFWQNLIAKVRSQQIKYKLLEIKKLWMRGQALAHVSNDGLSQICDAILPVFINYASICQLELKLNHRKFTPSFNKKIQHYLADLDGKIKDIHKLLCENMLLRLELMSDKHPGNTDIIFFIYKKLSELGFTERKDDVPYYIYHHLTTAQFVKFHEFILKYGTNEQIAQLLSCQWLKTNAEFVTHLNRNQILVIPKILLAYTKTFFSEFFNWPSFGEKLLSKHFILLSQLRLIQNVRSIPERLGDFYHEPNLQFLLATTSLLYQSYTCLENSKPRHIVLRYLFRSRIIFVSKFEHLLQQYHHQILTQKIAIAKVLAEQLKTRLIFELDVELLTSTKFRNDLSLFMQSIEQDLKHLKVDTTYGDWKRYTALFKKITDEELNFQTNATKSDVSPNATCADKASVIACQPQDNMLLNRTKHDVQNLALFTLSQTENFMNVLSQANSQLAQLKTTHSLRDLKTVFKPFVKAIFQNYLKMLIQCSSIQEAQSELAKIQANILFESLAPSYIRKRFNELQNLLSSSHWSIFLSKCHSMIVCLAEDEDRNCLVINLVQDITTQRDTKGNSRQGFKPNHT